MTCPELACSPYPQRAQMTCLKLTYFIYLYYHLMFISFINFYLLVILLAYANLISYLFDFLFYWRMLILLAFAHSNLGKNIKYKI